jgi:hypothetical protein
MTTRVAECTCGQLKVRVTAEPIRGVRFGKRVRLLFKSPWL